MIDEFMGRLRDCVVQGTTLRNAGSVGEVPGTLGNGGGQSPEMPGFAAPAAGRHHAGHVKELSQEVEQLLTEWEVS
jgi:hypothetical protein